METFTYNTRAARLEQGQTYQFIYKKLVILEDGKEYMVVEDPFSVRHFIDYQPGYESGILPDGTITCEVVKINCTGRIFLEPKLLKTVNAT